MTVGGEYLGSQHFLVADNPICELAPRKRSLPEDSNGGISSSTCGHIP